MIYHLLQAMMSRAVCSPVLFPAWCDSSLCERRGAIFSLAITEAFPSESASTLRIETFGCVFQTVGECDRRPWSLCGIMNDAVMSPGSQVGAHLEGEKKNTHKKKGTRYGIVYNTSERASLYNCEKRSCGKLAASLTGDLSVDDITHAPRGSTWRRVWPQSFVLRCHNSPKASYLSLPGSVICCIREFEKYLGWSQFPLRLSVYLSIVSFPPLFVFSEKKKKKKRAKSSVYSQLGRSVDMAARELKELKDCVWSVPAG